MRIPTLATIVGTAFTATAACAGPIPESAYSTSAMIPQEDIDAFWKARAEAESRRAPGRRSLLSAARGPVYAYRDTFDGFDADQLLPQDGPGLYIRLGGFPQSVHGGLSIGGQLNLDNAGWQSNSWGGIVDNAAAITNNDGNLGNGEYNGPPGGPDPTGVRDGMLHVQRASVNDPVIDEGSGFETYETFTNFYVGTSDRPLFVEIDVYKPNHETFQWVRPLSYTEGCFVTGILMGGYQSGGLFLPLAQMYGDPNLIEGAIILANVAGDPDSGEFVLNPKMISEGGWFTLGMLIDMPHTMQILVRDSETLADNDTDGSPDWKMPMNQVTGLRMFEEYGYGIEEGWASVLPGTLDDPMTTDIEGAGYAVNGDGEVTDRYFYNGNDVATPYAKGTIDAIRLYHGSDAFVSLPGYQIQDWWWDDLRVRGAPFPQPDPIPAYRIPYADDMERWNVGPLGLQGGRWTSARGMDLDIVETRNHTPPPGSGDGAPTKSLRIPNFSSVGRFQNRLTSGLPITPRVRGQAGDPAVLSVAWQAQAPEAPFGITGLESGFDILQSGGGGAFHTELSDVGMGPLWTSAIDVNGLGDGRFYVRQRKPVGTDIAGGEFDPLSPAAGLAGEFYTPDQEGDLNSPFINVVAAPAGQSELTLAADVWHVIRMESEPGGGARGAGADPHTLRVYVSQNDGPFVELFPNGDDSQRFTTGSLAPTNLRIEIPVVSFVGIDAFFIDDIFFDGPTQSDTIVPLASEFADDSPWEFLPQSRGSTTSFVDSLDTYEKDRPATPQGFANHRLGFMPIEDPDVRPIRGDWEEIEFIAGAPALSNGDPVRAYQIVSIDHGAPGFAVDDIVAVSDDILREYDVEHDIYGVPEDDGFGGINDPTAWYILDAVGGAEIARGTWFLANATGEAVFDDVVHTDMGARYSYRQEFRYTANPTYSAFVSAAAEGVENARGSRGDVVKLTNLASLRDYTLTGQFAFLTLEMFTGFFPLAQATGETSVASLSFDIYVAQPTFTSGLYAEFDGGTADGGQITALGFGGEGFQSGNAMGGPRPFLGTGSFSVLVPNPDPAPGEPVNVWEDTGTPVPTEQWFTVTIEVNTDSLWSVKIDGVAIASGTALDAKDANLNTTSLDGVSFQRFTFGESDGLPTPGVVSWSPRPFDAAAFAGEHHFFHIDGDLSVEAGQTLPSIWPVDSDTGVPETDMMGMPATRPLAPGDIVALPNVNPDDGQPLAFPPLGPRFEIVNGARGSLIASGTWFNLGLPGQEGVDDPAPAGGLLPGATPPYNDSEPFETILLGSYENIGPTTILPSDVWYIDQFSLYAIDPGACPLNLDGAGDAVDSGDLAVLLAAWGTTDPQANVDGVGVVDSGDLAVLLAAWGPCP